MLIALLLVGIAFIFLELLLDRKSEGGFGVFGLLMSGISLIVLIFMCVALSRTSVIDEKLAMYESENERIQTEIVNIVEGYKEYENSTYEKLKVESPITLVGLFPDLKANELVSKQMDVYLDNNQKIRGLKEEKINASIYRWWIYFGR